jgi:hypothetical protein
MFSVLHAGQLELFRLNFGEVILLPKVHKAERIQQYRPICLLNVSFKIFMKQATIRLNTVADHVVQPSKTAFMQGRNILDGVVMRGIVAQIKIMEEPSLIFTGLWFGIYLGLPLEKYKIMSWKKKEFKDLEDLLVSFRLYL